MWARAGAGLVPGFFLAAALVGLACWLWPGLWQATLVPGLVAFGPVWAGVFCAAFRFNRARQAWLWLSALALTGLGLLRLLQATGWVQ